MTPIRRLSWLFAVLVPALLPAVLAPPSARAAETGRELTLAYEMWKGGFHGLSFEARLFQSRAAYRIAFSARTEGLIGWLYPYRVETRSAGLVGDAGIRALSYRSESRSRGKERRRMVRYLVDGPAGPDDRRDPRAAGTQDPASAVFAVIEAFARAGRCEGVVPVFDGKRRYDLVLSHLGQATLRPSRYALYSGPAVLCRVRMTRHSGFKKKRAGGFPSEIKLWLAPAVEGGPALPVRLEGKSDLGSLVVHLVAARARMLTEQARR